jgi:hypothetical protein
MHNRRNASTHLRVAEILAALFPFPHDQKGTTGKALANPAAAPPSLPADHLPLCSIPASSIAATISNNSPSGPIAALI